MTKNTPDIRSAITTIFRRTIIRTRPGHWHISYKTQSGSELTQTTKKIIHDSTWNKFKAIILDIVLVSSMNDIVLMNIKNFDKFYIKLYKE